MNPITHALQLSFNDPAAAGRALMGWRLSQIDAWSLLVAATCIWVIILELSSGGMLWLGLNDGGGAIVWTLTIISISASWIVALFFVGRFLGANPRMSDVILVHAWPQVVQLAIQVVLLGFEIVMPAIGALLWIVALMWMLWLTLHLINEVMGFRSLMRALAAFALSLVGASLLGSIFVFPMLGLLVL